MIYKRIYLYIDVQTYCVFCHIFAQFTTEKYKKRCGIAMSQIHTCTVNSIWQLEPQQKELYSNVTSTVMVTVTLLLYSIYLKLLFLLLLLLLGVLIINMRINIYHKHQSQILYSMHF